MASEKYVVGTTENPFQITMRNMLNPCGYVFLGNCNDAVSLLRLVRNYNPDFIVVDTSMPLRDLRNTIETIDDEMLCACIVVGDMKNVEIMNLLDKSRGVTFCQKPVTREILVNTVELSVMYQKRVMELDKKLKDMTENYETRKVVERAKWILMERNGLSETEAYERMRKKSMDSRMTMKAIAEAIIFTHEITNK